MDMLDWEEFLQLFKYYVVTGWVWTANEKHPNITMLPACHYDGFQLMYSSYLSTNDDGVTTSPRTKRKLKDQEGNAIIAISQGGGLTEDIDGNIIQRGTEYDSWDMLGPSQLYLELKNIVRGGRTDVEIAAAKPLTRERVEFCSLMLAECATKAFGRTGDQKEKFARARAQEFCLYECAYDCYPDHLEFILSVDSLSNVMNCLSQYPDLKTTFFRTILNSDFDRTAFVTKVLINNHRMTMFNMILVFVMTEEKTAAHTHPQVFGEYLKWFAVYESLVSLYKKDWSYYTFINPASIKTAIANWPNLAACAFMFALSEGHSDSLSKIKTDRLNTDFPVIKSLSTKTKAKWHHGAIVNNKLLKNMSEDAAMLLGLKIQEMIAANADDWFEEIIGLKK